MKKPLIFFVVLLLSIVTLKAQPGYSYVSEDGNLNYALPSPVAPEAGALMKYTDYPTTLYHGLVNIDIPLYVLKSGEISIPVSISYHPSGIKVYEANGNLGVGWTLNADFSISRSINGYPDEKNESLPPPYGVRQGYLYSENVPPFGDNGGNDNNLMTVANYPMYVKVGHKCKYDVEPDLFYYRTLTKSGKFFFKRDITQSNPSMEVVSIPFEPIVIIGKDDPDGTKRLTSFELIDDDGMKYIFGDEESTTVASSYSDEQCKQRTQWKVTSIVSPVRGDRVTFQYENMSRQYTREYQDFLAIEDSVSSITTRSPYQRDHEPEDLKWPFMVERIGIDAYYKNINIVTVESQLPPESLGQPQQAPLGHIGEGVSYTGVPGFPVPESIELLESPVKQIEGDNVKLIFTHAYNPHTFRHENKLLSISVVDKSTNDTIRQIRFMQSPYKETSSPMDKRKLDAVEIADRDGNVVERYSFEYNGEAPDERYKCADHWGYANDEYYSNYDVDCKVIMEPVNVWGIWERPERIPSADAYQFVELKSGSVINMPGHRYSANNANPEYTGMGMLKSITYPTGRKTVFSFESNRFDNGGTATYGGGMRVAKIEEFEMGATSPSLARYFKYGENEDGVGNAKRIITADDYKIECYGVYKNFYSGEPFSSSFGEDPFRIISRIRMYFGRPVSDVSFENGATVFYNKVTEYRQDSIMGKTVYTYSAPNTSGNQHFPLTAMSFIGTGEWKGGKLLERTDYKILHDTYMPISSIEYVYDTFLAGSFYFPKLHAHYMVRNGNYGTMDDIDMYYDNLDEEVQSTFLRGYYGKHFKIDYGCERLVGEHTITYDDLLNRMTVHQSYHYDNDDHMYPSRKIRYVNSKNSEESRIWYPLDKTYSANSPEEIARQNLVAKNRLNTPLEQSYIRSASSSAQIKRTSIRYTVENGRVLPSTILTNTGQNGADEERVRVLLYDSYGNPVRIEKDGVETIFLWGYKGQFVIAQIDGVKFDQLPMNLKSSINTISTRFKPSTNDLALIDGLRTDTSYPYAQVNTYTYDNIRGMLSATDPQGIKTGYEYDSFDRLKEVYIMEDNSRRVLESYEYHYAAEL